MTIIAAENFDKAVARTASVVSGVSIPLREKGLKFFENFDFVALLETSEDNIREVMMSHADKILIPDATLLQISGLIRADQEKIFEEARTDGVSDFDLEVGDLDKESSLYKDTTNNTVALFTQERDLNLYQRTIERIVARKGLVQKIDKKLTPYDLLYKGFAAPAEKRYWTFVSSAWLGRSRTAGAFSVMKDAGLAYSKIIAMIDEKTTNICRFLNGKRVLTSAIEAKFAGLVVPRSTSNWIEEIPPPSTGTDDGGAPKPLLLLPPSEPGGKPRPMAQRTEEYIPGDSGLDMGKYKQFMSDEELSRELGPPPYHLLCRTILVPEEFPEPFPFRAQTEEADVPEDIKRYIQEER